jgi:gliding motility-associated-like protein
MVTQEGLYTLAVTVNNCTTTDSIQIDYISFTPNFLGANQNNLCDGEQIDLKVKDTFPGITYLWSDGSSSSFLEVTQTGKYWVDVEVGRCKITDTIDFEFNPLPIFNLGPDERLCEDQTLDLTITANSSTYRWSDGTTQASNTIRFPGGLIWAEAQNLYCKFRDSLFVDYDEYPLIDLGPDTTICDDRSVVLTAGANAEQLAWSNGSTAASIEVDKSGIYSLTATNGVCQITDDVEVTSRECYYFNVFVPNAFSPNNDGVNDNLVPYFPLGVSVQEFSMSIFDRWGNILFQTNDINSTWDGYWNGKLMPEGVYIYYLEVSYVDDLGPGTARRNGDFILIK